MNPGTRLGSYEVVAPLGAGGMGEVYRARDTRLGRDVALKILPAAMTADTERVARFEREAQALAALNHPNIAQIYGIESGAIVMELVEGDDLSTRIARGAMALDEALPIARQVALALEAAHDAGIVHRDLKPANIRIKSDGTVKVLDFGLAKAVQGEGSRQEASPSNSPTLTARATELGVVLGTAAYMAPEQAKGRAVDRRADVWAFGVVLYEMLTGRRAFAGDDVTEVMAAVLRDAPSHDALPAGTPAAIRRLLRRCLEKDPRKRLRDLADVGIELDEAMSGQVLDASYLPTAPTSSRKRLLGSLAIALIVAAVAAVAAWQLKPGPVPADATATRFTIPLEENQVLPNYSLPNIALSPDGRRVAYRTSRGIFVRHLDELRPREVSRAAGSGLWFSPDGQALLYATPSGLSKVPVAGGPPLEVVPLPQNGGVHWAADGAVVYSTVTSISRVPATGGASEVLVPPGPGLVGWPQVLPGGRSMIFTRVAGGADRATAQIVLKRLDGSGETVVLDGVAGARYVETGHLVYGLESRLMVVPFDLDRERVTGSAVPMPEAVYVSGTTAWAQAAFSRTGTMIYLPPTGGQGQTQLVWSDEEGNATPVLTVPRVYSDPKLSPDGRRVALHLWDEDNDIWVGDLVRGGLTRMSFSPTEEETPVWSPDGTELAYAAQRTGEPRALLRRLADAGASASEHRIWQDPGHFHVNDWSPDGRAIVVEIGRTGTANDLLAIDVQTGRDTVLIATAFRERQARFSPPDGKWLAYTSNESGRDEIYVQPYPALDRRVTVSTAGGTEPVWSRDGRRLFFRSTDSVMVAEIASAAPLEFKAPRALFADRFVRPQGDTHTHFDVDAGGRLLMIDSPRANTTPDRLEIHVVLNWAETVKRTVPSK